MVTIVNAKMKFVNVGSGVINCGVCFRKLRGLSVVINMWIVTVTYEAVFANDLLHCFELESTD